MANLDDPLVSVVIPTYGRPEMLQEAIESIARQDYAPIEVIIVDDASPQPVEPSLSLRDVDRSITHIRHDENRGANAARNTGISAARGEILAFLDDDDRWLPNTVSAFVRRLHELGAETGVVLVGQRYVDEHGRTTDMSHPEVAPLATTDLLVGTTAGPFSTMAVRHDLVRIAGIPDEDFPSLQDREWQVRLSRHAYFGTVAEPLVIRRMGGYDQIADRFIERRDVSYPRFLAKHAPLAKDLGCEGRFRGWLAALVAASALQAGAYREAIRYGLRSIRSDPRRRSAWVTVGLALGGDLTYRPAIGLKRAAARRAPR